MTKHSVDENKVKIETYASNLKRRKTAFRELSLCTLSSRHDFYRLCAGLFQNSNLLLVSSNFLRL